MKITKIICDIPNKYGDELDAIKEVALVTAASASVAAVLVFGGFYILEKPNRPTYSFVCKAASDCATTRPK
jgi:hypothetical protein